jgi:hypothetical protein
MRGNQNNAELRQAAKNAGVYFWQIAELWNVSESYMTRLMRRELNSEERTRFLSTVDQLKSEQE